MPKTKSKTSNISKKDDASNKNASIGGDVTDSVVVVGDGNQTTFQKIINIFKGESENTEHRNRRVMLKHMENFWIKGVLEKSLHGVALLELGIKEDANAVNYPWGIKKASTNETLPTEKPMLEIFKEIGLGRSLLILGTPGSGKTTMLLELTRQLIDLARQDENEPIPVVFNLSSWTDKLTLADWLVEQLNIFYYVPKKTAQKFVTEDKTLLLLDGLDEVKGDRREKCVDAINEFRKEHGLTSLVVCSRIEEYQAIQTKLSLAGAITLQPLTSHQVDTYFDKFGKSLSSLRQILKKDKTLQELTETPLMLSIMVLAYKDVNIKEIPELKNNKEQRKHLFDNYINRMFERPTRSIKENFSKERMQHYLSWLAYQMVQHNLITYQIETMQPSWLDKDKKHRLYKWVLGLMFGLIGGLSFGLIGGLIIWLIYGLIIWLIYGLIIGLFVGQISGLQIGLESEREEIKMIDSLRWSWKLALKGLMSGLFFGLMIGLMIGLSSGLSSGLFVGLFFGLIASPMGVLIFGLSDEQIDETKHPGQRLKQTFFNAFFIIGSIILIIVLIFWLIGVPMLGLVLGIFFWFIFGRKYGLLTLSQHYALRFILIKQGFLPRSLFAFLEFAVDLIFIRRVGGSYIFVHRLLMEHFAEMYIEKENK